MTSEHRRPGSEGKRDQTIREQRLAEALEILVSGFDEITGTEGFQRYLASMSRFHRYSYGNILMIMSQRPDATRVAGYRQWQRLGRQVRRGEQGIRILVPHKQRIRDQDPHPGSADEEDDSAALYVTRGFGVGTVFDISQTDGEPLPEPPMPCELEGESPASFWLADQLRGLLEDKDVHLELTELDGPKGTYHPTLKRVQLQVGMSPDQTAKTLCHETAHFVADHAAGIHRRDAETVAEASSFVILHRFGVDTSSYSFPYLAAWTEDQKTLTRNLGAIQRVSDSLIRSIEERSQWGTDLSAFRERETTSETGLDLDRDDNSSRS